MTTLLRNATQILETAVEAGSGPDLMIAIDHTGGIRVIEAAGWTLSSLTAHVGASAVFKVQKAFDGAAVEALDGSQRCLLQRKTRGQLPHWLSPAVLHPITLHVNPMPIAASGE